MSFKLPNPVQLNERESMSDTCPTCGQTIEAKKPEPKKHEHYWSVAYRSTHGTVKTTKMHCRECGEFKEVDGHIQEGGKNILGLGDKAMRARRAR